MGNRCSSLGHESSAYDSRAESPGSARGCVLKDALAPSAPSQDATLRRSRLLRCFGARILPPPMTLLSLVLATLVAAPSSGSAAQRPERGRDLGIPFEGTPGPLDAITDVAGVEVGDGVERPGRAFDAITDVAGVEVGHRTLVEGN